MQRILSNKFITIYFRNDEGDSFQLKYQLFESPLLSRWLEIMKMSEGLTIEGGGHFFGRGFSDAHELERVLNECIKVVNTHAMKTQNPELMITMTAKVPMTSTFLNDLHAEFERLEAMRINSDAVRNALTLMNISIHQAEQFAYESPNGSDHIQVITVPGIKKPLEDEDYKLFDADYRFGEMYMTYGITGVPTKDAYINRAEPTPQNVYSNGVYLCFFKDSPFLEREGLESWLKSKGLDPADPKLAIGYIPLGKIISPHIETPEDVLPILKRYNKITEYKVSEEDLPVPDPAPKARWPFDSELMYHLDYVPFLDLGVEFDPKPLLEEAMRALPYFVVHRDHYTESKDSVAKWRSLGLRALNGDYTKTQYHTSYGVTGKAVYKNTIFAELCPRTMDFLSTITDLERCERVRYMLLEPGASIRVHRDSEDRDVCMAINISLNMPEGCEFLCNLEQDGSKNEFTQSIPFSNDGSVILFNNAKYHSVVNNSDTPRIHIIFHGPIKFKDDDLIAKALKQNFSLSKKTLLRELIKKKTMTGEPLDKTPSLLSDWQISGLDQESLSDKIELVVWNHDNYQSEEKRKKSLHNITLASLFPLKHRVIDEGEIDSVISRALSSEKEFIVLIAAGTFVSGINQFTIEIMRTCWKMKINKEVVSGHIMDFVKEGSIPYLHEQLLIVNLKEFGKHGLPNLGPLFTKSYISFPSYGRSEENIHDDYTPLWIGAGSSVASRTGVEAWGSLLLKGIVVKDLKCSNLPLELRNSKFYAYPRDPHESAWNLVQAQIDSRFKDTQTVFTFNNEPLDIVQIPGFQINSLISVASGLKPFKIYHKYKSPSGTRLHFVDISQRSLEYVSKLMESKTLNKIIATVQEFSTIRDQQFVRLHLESTARDFFNSDLDELVRAVNPDTKATFQRLNLVTEGEQICSLLDEESSFIIWVSNAFYNNTLYYLLTPEEAWEKFLELGRTVAAKLKCEAFLLRNTNSIVIGTHWANPKGLITDGAPHEYSDHEADWTKLT